MLPKNAVIAWLAQALRPLNMIHSLDEPLSHKAIGVNAFKLDSAGTLKLYGFYFSKGNKHESALSFVAPEQQGRQDENGRYPGELFTPEVDIYCLGATIYHLCMLTPTYDIANGEIANLMREEQLQPISEEKYGAALNTAIFRMLNIDPKKRPTAANLLQEDFIRETLDDEVDFELILMLPPVPVITFKHAYKQHKPIGEGNNS